MIKHNQDGAVSGLAVSLVLCIILLLGAIGFGAWAFTSQQDYKNNSDQKSAVAADAAAKKEAVAKDKEFAEEYKKPLKSYDSSEATASLHIEFPKTWSGYVADASAVNGSSTFDGYFASGVVPSKDDQNSVFALRVQLLSQPYSQILETFASQQTSGKVSVKAYSLPKLPKVVGVQVVGKLPTGKDVTMVVLPLRSQTIEVWTEGNQYVNDFNRYILPNISFAP